MSRHLLYMMWNERRLWIQNILATVNCAVLGCMCLFELELFLDICSVLGLLDHMESLFLVFLRNFLTVLQYQ